MLNAVVQFSIQGVPIDSGGRTGVIMKDQVAEVLILTGIIMSTGVR